MTEVFPTLTWRESEWTGEDWLPAWAGIEICFDDQRRAPSKPDWASTWTSAVDLCVQTPDGEKAAPGPEHARAYEVFRNGGDRVVDAVMRAILDRYPEERRQFLRDQGWDLGSAVPPIQSPDGVRDLVSLIRVYVQAVAKDGCAYIGLEMGCTWEHEHGLGVILHGDHVVAVAQAADAFQDWHAELDGGTPLAVTPAAREVRSTLPGRDLDRSIDPRRPLEMRLRRCRALRETALVLEQRRAAADAVLRQLYAASYRAGIEGDVLDHEAEISARRPIPEPLFALPAIVPTPAIDDLAGTIARREDALADVIGELLEFEAKIDERVEILGEEVGYLRADVLAYGRDDATSVADSIQAACRAAQSFLSDREREDKGR